MGVGGNAPDGGGGYPGCPRDRLQHARIFSLTQTTANAKQDRV